MVYPKMWFPLKNLITTASHYMILAITVERYLVICHRKRKLLSPLRNISFVLIFSLLVTIPKFFEFVHLNEHNKSGNVVNHTTRSKTNDSLVDNDSSSRSTYSQSYMYHISEIGENPDFLLFNAYHEVLVITFCLVTIFYCNYQICCKIKISANIKNR